MYIEKGILHENTLFLMNAMKHIIKLCTSLIHTQVKLSIIHYFIDLGYKQNFEFGLQLKFYIWVTSVFLSIWVTVKILHLGYN
jgi:hypothetical protein